MFRRRVQALDGLGKAGEMPPQAMLRDVLVVPVPGLARAGGAGEERGEDLVVQHHPLGVEAVEVGVARVVAFDASRLGQNRRQIRAPVQQLADGIRAQHVHRPPRDVKIRAGIEKACWKRDVKPETIDMVVSQVTSGLEADYEREVPSSEVGNRTMEALRQVDKVAYVRFASVYRDFKDIDEFIDEIRSMGRNRAKNTAPRGGKSI